MSCSVICAAGFGQADCRAGAVITLIYQWVEKETDNVCPRTISIDLLSSSRLRKVDIAVRLTDIIVILQRDSIKGMIKRVSGQRKDTKH